MTFRLSILVLTLTISFSSIAQESKTLQATRITTPPKIDGTLDDSVWENLPVYSDFFMLEPSNEGNASQELRTEVKLAYDDKAVYVAAYMYDNEPDLIPKQFSQRDDTDVQADLFMIALNTYNDGLNETRFWVTSAGTIADSKMSQNNQDFGFDVVFQCRVSSDEKGWYAEYKIPYNALRFPELDVQNWSVNFFRRLVRQNELHSWNRIDKSVGRETQYNGIVTGVTDINPPVRLTFFPFAQGVYSVVDGESATDFSGGLDLKYGLSDSFTLDAQLIPDFGQVTFDNVRLNLGPFEQTFGENRAFFTEGVDLFRKGRIFFSRRIGNGPTGGVGELADNEEVEGFPSKVNLLNSVKISGRTKNNLGVGFLNSITERTFADIRNTETGERRKVEVEPLTNYNVFVLDQQFNQNSSISVINTNVIRSGSAFRDANVTALAFNLSNKENSFATAGRAIVSNVSFPGNLVTGFQSELDVFKTKGKLRYRAGHDFANTTFNINDLGLNNRNNFNNFVVGGSYEIFEPTKIFNKYRINFTARHRRLYQPNVQTDNIAFVNAFFQLKSRLAFGVDFFTGGKRQDYFEPRVAGRFVTYEPRIGTGGFISTDYRKKLAVDVNYGFNRWFGNQDQTNYRLEISPRFRFSNKFLVIFSSEYSTRIKNFGWVDNTDKDVFLGLRDIDTFENTLDLSYNFDSYKAINLRFRNFWSTADYSRDIFYILNQDGSRTETNYDLAERRNPNTNFNIWNLDLSFRWRFAPGSEASLLYRNQIFNNDDLSTLGYTESLGNLFDQPIQHTISLRITYFIDFNNVRSLFNKAG